MAVMQEPAPKAPHGEEGSPPEQSEQARRFALAVARLAAEHKTENVVVLDLRELSSFADFFVIGTGTSERQMHAVAELVEEYARTLGREPFRATDRRERHWVLADYIDVVIHLFDAGHREHYDLDGLWGDAPRMAWETEALEAPAQRRPRRRKPRAPE